MVKLEELKPGLPLVGLEPSSVATVAAVVPIGEGSVQVFYRTSDGQTRERLLGRADEANLSVAVVERPWSFDGDGAAFQLTCEAKRIDLAFLFDPMMAVHTSNVDRCLTKSLPSTNLCCQGSHCVSSSLTIQVPARPLWPASIFVNWLCEPMRDAY